MRSTRAKLVRAIVAGVAAVVSGAAHASPAAADSWAFGGGFEWGQEYATSTGATVVDPTTHVLYTQAGFCGNAPTCSTDDYSFAGIGPTRTRIDGFCSALYPAEHLFTCPDAAGKALVRFKSGLRLDRIPLGRTPARTAADASDGTVWVTVDVATSSRELLAVRNGAVTSRLALPWEPGEIAVDASSHAVWVLKKTGEAVVRVAGGVVGPVRAVPASSSALQVDPVSHLAYVLSPGGTPGLTAVPPTGAVSTVALPTTGAGSRSFVLDPARGEAIVFDGAQGLSVYKDGAVVDTIDHPQADFGFRLVIDQAAHVIYLIDYRGYGQKIVLTDEPVAKLGRATGRTQVDLTRLAVAVFSTPMDHASTESAFTVRASSLINRADVGGAPDFPVPGRLAWIGDTVAVFVPEAPVPYGVTYTATITTDAKSKAGRPLFGGLTWAFATRSPKVLASGPAADGLTAVPTSAPMYAVFDDPVDQASIEAATRLVPADDEFHPVAGRFGWLAPNILVFVPDAPLPPGAQFEWRVSGGTTFFGGPRFTTAGG